MAYDIREDLSLFHSFVPTIEALRLTSSLQRSDLLTQEFRLHQGADFEIYYAPFFYINTTARVALVGITPGWTQMEISYRVAQDGIKKGLSIELIGEAVKREAAFAGDMRPNVVRMLDGIGLAEALGIGSSMELFGAHSGLMHATSAIRYPVFRYGENYRGRRPPLLKRDVLRRFVEVGLSAELAEVHEALVIPLGKIADAAVQHLVFLGLISPDRCTVEFPHPSGENGHMKKFFDLHRDSLTHTVRAWFSAKDSAK